jgi:hypothetical protein
MWEFGNAEELTENVDVTAKRPLEKPLSRH